jgi:outer membrane lipoprotein LolB
MSPGATRRHGVAVLLLLFVTGCATTPPVAPTASAPVWDSRTAGLATLKGWQAHGRVAVTRGREGFSGGFDWREREGGSDIDVRGPIGIGGLSIRRDGEEVRITTSRGDVLVSQSVDRDLEARLGVPLPVSYLRWWLIGQPAPAPAPQPAPGTVGFEQAGWQVSYEQFGAAPWSLPGRMLATRTDARIRVVVDRWETGQP